MDMSDTKTESFALIEKLNEIGIALSAEKNTPKLLEMILKGAKTILNADGGTLYLATEDKRHLQFEIIINDSLGIMMGAKIGEPIPFDPLPLYDEFGKPNNTMVAAHAALYKFVYFLCNVIKLYLYKYLVTSNIRTLITYSLFLYIYNCSCCRRNGFGYFNYHQFIQIGNIRRSESNRNHEVLIF